MHGHVRPAPGEALPREDGPRAGGRTDGPAPGAAERERLDRMEHELRELARALPDRIDADPERVESGLAQLVLTVVELLRKVLEHQAIRRMDGGTLSDEEVERLGLALLRLDERMEELKQLFGLRDADLEIDLGPLGRLT